ncbi:glutamate--cysteine ligase [Balneicella halophila]|uniref:Glutamate--cysteine ligase n=1 Tax=Balneicella halophila TaxID=1537566 RepID=A0A7L4UMJ2_BALHA|nr:glutamate--cysteine ligase [Balneicella halophila]PVX49362.1 glutamate--cysteine ligase [Balneicella halophila]
MSILSKEQLVSYFEEGCTPKEAWKVGVEHEKFLFYKDNLKRVQYYGEDGIEMLLKKFIENGWKGKYEMGNLLSVSKGNSNITLEPGGQFELSGAPLTTVHDISQETRSHFTELSQLASSLNMQPLCLGFDPISTRDDISWIPKQRYNIMRKHMANKDIHGLDMMGRTATIQVNLDYSSEEDMRKKMYVGQFLQPLVMALFANSPFVEGKDSRFYSYRSHVWNYTDIDRCGCLPFVLEKDFSFERWVDYLLQVPMLFVTKDDVTQPIDMMTFDEFRKGKSKFDPTMEDWETHISTVFPDIRLKRYIEMRGADGGCSCFVTALAAFWVGLLYDEDALEEIYQYVNGFANEEFLELRDLVAKKAIHSKIKGNLLIEVAKLVLAISKRGLTNRAKQLNIESEAVYLKPLEEIVDTAKTRAQVLVEQFNSTWKNNIQKVFDSCQCKMI